MVDTSVADLEYNLISLLFVIKYFYHIRLINLLNILLRNTTIIFLDLQCLFLFFKFLKISFFILFLEFFLNFVFIPINCLFKS